MKNKQIPPDLVDSVRRMSIVELCGIYGIKVKRAGVGYRIIDDRLVNSGKQNSSFSVTGNKFFRHSTGEYGDTINFYIDYIKPELKALGNRESFYQACIDLLKLQGEFISSDIEPPENSIRMQNKGISQDKNTVSQQKFAPREPFANDCWRVTAYLCQTRCIAYQIVKPLLQSGLLRQDIRGNACFCRYDSDGVLVGIEKHGTNTQSRFRATDGRKGFFLFYGKTENVCLFESAIDLLSFAEIYRQKLTAHLLVSMGGLNSLAEEIQQSYPDAELFCCTDNDKSGNQFADDVCRRLNYHRFQTKNCKDWNELLSRKKGLRGKNFKIGF